MLIGDSSSDEALAKRVRPFKDPVIGCVVPEYLRQPVFEGARETFELGSTASGVHHELVDPVDANPSKFKIARSIPMGWWLRHHGLWEMPEEDG